MADQHHFKKLNEGVQAWNRWRQEHPEISPDLRKADLHEVALSRIDFRRTNLDGANLRGANLRAALFDYASLCQTDLSNAKLRDVSLHRTFFKETILQHTNFHKASLLDTAFLNVDFSEAINLDTVIHDGSSIIGIDTIQRSKGNVPDIFLSGAGVSEPLVTCIRSSGRTPFDYYTCFISYSSRDRRFVKHLYRDLRKEGVLCWYAPESLKAGDKFPACITKASSGS